MGSVGAPARRGSAAYGVDVCPSCDGFGLIEDPDFCGDPDHCSPWIPCPRGCPEVPE